MISTATVVSISMRVNADRRGATLRRPRRRAGTIGRANPAPASLLEAGDVITVRGGGAAGLGVGDGGDVAQRAESPVGAARPEDERRGADRLLTCGGV